MKKIFTFGAIALAALATVSCNNEVSVEVLPAAKQLTEVHAAREANATKVTWQDLDESTKLIWEDTDAISIFTSAGENNWFTASDEAYTKYAQDWSSLTFSPNSEVSGEAPYIGVYPYDEQNKLVGDAENNYLQIPFVVHQIASAGKFNRYAFSAVAYSNDANLSFKNVYGLLAIKVGTEGITHITLQGNSDKDKFARNYGIVPDQEGNPIVSAVGKIPEDYVEAIYLYPEEGTFVVDKTYFLAVPPTTFNDGVTFGLYSGMNLVGEKSTDKELSVERNVIHEVPTLTVDPMKSTDVVSLPYSEPFTSGIGKFSIYNVSLPEGVSDVWTEAGTYGMKVTAYINKTNYASEAWLYSPLIDLAGASKPVLTFEHATNYFSSVDVLPDQAAIWVRVAGESWAKLSVSYPESLGWSFVSSGEVDLSEYADEKIQIAFQYVSTAKGAGTWEVKNFLVEDANAPIETTLSVADATVTVGANKTLSVTTNNTEGARTFKSGDESIVTVDENGVVTGVKAGTATITIEVAAAGRYTAASTTCKVTVEEASSTTGGSITLDFESEASSYYDWEITTINTKCTNSNVDAHGGNYFGNTDGKTTGTITTASKIDSPTSIVFYISKQSTNTTASSWKVQVSSDGSTWTQVGDNQSASSGITRGQWTEVRRDLSNYSNVYVRVRYDGTTAIRCIDDLVIEYE